MDNIIQRVADLKCSLQQLLHKMETEGESSQWPEYLEQYSVISAQVAIIIENIDYLGIIVDERLLNLYKVIINHLVKIINK